MGNLFNTYLYNPILAVLVFIYENISFGDLGLSVILLTIAIRLVLFPIFYKSAKDQSLMQRLQPHIKKIQLDHKDNREEQSKKLLALYREHKLNPFSGFVLLLVQLPIFFALYQVFVKGIAASGFDNQMFLGLINLGEKSILIAFVAAALQYFQGKLSLPKNKEVSGTKESPLASMGKTMVYMGPILTLSILSYLPSALGLYWATSTLFSLGQQIYINKKLPKTDNHNNESSSGKNNKTS